MSELFKPLDPEAPIDKSRKNLPHWEQAGTTYFITYRLGDSVAQSVLKRWKEELEFWKSQNPQVSEADKNEFMKIFSEKRQAWLDAGHGSCVLKNPKAADIVEEAFRIFDEQRYSLGDYVIMPNHVHVIVRPYDGWTIDQTLHSWKSYTSKEIFKALGENKNVWMPESWDTIVRGMEQWRYYVHYIRNNPVKATLREGEFRLGCGSLKCDV